MNEKSIVERKEASIEAERREMFNRVYDEYDEVIEYWDMGYRGNGIIRDGSGVTNEFETEEELRRILENAKESKEYNESLPERDIQNEFRGR